jgi:hypothetical protein
MAIPPGRRFEPIDGSAHRSKIGDWLRAQGKARAFGTRVVGVARCAISRWRNDGDDDRMDLLIPSGGSQKLTSPCSMAN